MATRSSPSIQRLVASLIVGYALTATMVLTALLYLYDRQFERLAKSYAQSVRLSILSGDLRQAVMVLLPAVDRDFRSISISDGSGKRTINLPSDGVSHEAGPFIFQIIVPISSEAADSPSADNGYLAFRYSANGYLLFLSSLAIGLLMLFLVGYYYLRRRLVQHHELLARENRVDFQNNLTLQVAHDIRSPVSALNMIVATSTHLPDDQKELIQRTSLRINEIANDLLLRNIDAQVPTLSDGTASTAVACDLIELVSNLVQEKLVGHPAGKLRFAPVGDLILHRDDRFDPKELARSLSNLLNNALDAVGDNGRVDVSVARHARQATISIIDDGPGIPGHVLNQLGEVRVSYGKNYAGSGSGLGVLHAKKAITAMGGSLSIQSRLGKGTLVTISFPSAQ